MLSNWQSRVINPTSDNTVRIDTQMQSAYIMDIFNYEHHLLEPTSVRRIPFSSQRPVKGIPHCDQGTFTNNLQGGHNIGTTEIVEFVKVGIGTFPTVVITWIVWLFPCHSLLLGNFIDCWKTKLCRWSCSKLICNLLRNAPWRTIIRHGQLHEAYNSFVLMP